MGSHFLKCLSRSLILFATVKVRVFRLLAKPHRVIFDIAWFKGNFRQAMRVVARQRSDTAAELFTRTYQYKPPLTRQP